MMRESIKDIASMVRPIPYPAKLPDGIEHLHCYLVDSGHCILAVPEVFLAEIGDNPMRYEVALPAKYVIETGWRPIAGTDSISVPVEYNDMFGAIVPDGYEEW